MASLPESAADPTLFRCALAAVVADSGSMSDGAADSVPDSGLDSGLGADTSGSVSLCAGSSVFDARSALGSGSVSLGSSSEVLPAELGDTGMAALMNQKLRAYHLRT